jgi:hypothetical protein
VTPRSAVLAAALLVAACTPRPGAPDLTVVPLPTTAADTTSTASTPVAGLAQLVIDDHPDGAGYRRDLFMPGGRWQDPDGNGCDARKDALRAQTLTPITSTAKCSTVGGTWSLVYVPGQTTNPADVDADHLVPLANAWRSGARNWPTDRLVAYAADPEVLWIVEDNANEAKGDRGPEGWRPAVHDVWCRYGRTWTAIKERYGLTATTAERDALGQMEETC